MYVLDLLKTVFKECARIVISGAEIQENARTILTSKFSSILDSCHDSFGQVKARLVPIKESYKDPKAFVVELRKFAADKVTRDAFKPQKLCSDVDGLLTDLESNLNPLKYSISIGSSK